MKDFFILVTFLYLVFLALYYPIGLKLNLKFRIWAMIVGFSFFLTIIFTAILSFGVHLSIVILITVVLCLLGALIIQKFSYATTLAEEDVKEMGGTGIQGDWMLSFGSSMQTDNPTASKVRGSSSRRGIQEKNNPLSQVKGHEGTDESHDISKQDAPKKEIHLDWLDRALMHKENGRFAKAIEAFEKALAEKEDDPSACALIQIELSDIYKEQGKIDKASDILFSLLKQQEIMDDDLKNRIYVLLYSLQP